MKYPISNTIKVSIKEKFALERLFVQTNKIVLLPEDINLVFTETFLLHCLNVLKLLGVAKNKKDMALIRYLQFETTYVNHNVILCFIAL